jgi:hypothetical protein
MLSLPPAASLEPGNKSDDKRDNVLRSCCTPKVISLGGLNAGQHQSPWPPLIDLAGATQCSSLLLSSCSSKSEVHNIHLLQKSDVHNINLLQKSDVHNIHLLQKSDVHNIHPLQKSDVHNIHLLQPPYVPLMNSQEGTGSNIGSSSAQVTQLHATPATANVQQHSVLDSRALSKPVQLKTRVICS